MKKLLYAIVAVAAITAPIMASGQPGHDRREVQKDRKEFRDLLGQPV